MPMVKPFGRVSKAGAVLSLADVCRMTGKSRPQVLHLMRSKDLSFPLPAAQVGISPVWSRVAIDTYLRERFAQRANKLNHSSRSAAIVARECKHSVSNGMAELDRETRHEDAS